MAFMHLYRWRFLLGSLLWMAANCPLATAQNMGFRFEKKVSKVKMRFEDLNNLIVLPMTVNGKQMRFILDTGVRYNLIVKKEYAKDLNLAFSRTMELVGADRNQKMKGYVANNVSVHLKGIINERETFVVLDEDYLKFEAAFGTDVQGVLGYDLFKRFVVEINYDQKTVTFHEPKGFVVPSDFTEVPLSMFFTKGMLATDVLFENQTALNGQFLLDTGASFPFLINMTAADSAQLPARVILDDMGRGLGGSLQGVVGKVRRVQLGAFAFENVVTFFQDSEHFAGLLPLEGRSGIIGAGLLNRFVVLVDFDNAQVFFKKGRRFREPFDYNRSGILLDDEADQRAVLTVKMVLLDSPAGRAGVMPNDLIINVNGLSGGELTIEHLRAVFKGKPNQPIALTVLRQGVPMQFRFRLAELI